MLSKSVVPEMVRDQLWPALRTERDRLDNIDKWWRWDHDKPHSPRASTTEYRELIRRAFTPWLRLVVTSVVQQLYVDGYRGAGAAEDAGPWRAWQANRMDARQIPLHRAATAYGTAYEVVSPGKAPDGSSMPVMRGVSPRRMVAFYGEDDEWPAVALEVEPAKIEGAQGWLCKVYDDEAVHWLQADTTGAPLKYLEYREHGLGVCPVVRFTAELDLEGRATGDVEPFIPVAARIDQTVFDRLVVQRFASWVVRTIAGMAKPDNPQDQQAEKMRLAVEDVLVASDPETRFGSLPATPLGGFIEAAEADVRTLAAVSQTPAHEMLGQLANLSAEALAAAEASLSRRVTERKYTLGESHEQALRLAGLAMGDTEAARDTAAQVRWRDMESRSLSQAADALGKLAQMLGVPVQILWEKIPGWTDTDVERAKALASQGGGIDALMAELLNGQTSPGAPGGNGQAGGPPAPPVSTFG